MSASEPRQLTARVRRLAGRVLGRRVPEPEPPELPSIGDGPYDAWLSLLDDRLAELDTACEREGQAALPRFRELDDDLWTVLLTGDYERYPAIREVLPTLPPPELQRAWNGTAGLEILTQAKAFYRRARKSVGAHGARKLEESAVLDFGCGWGRITRFFIREVPPERLGGCDPFEPVIELCRESRIPAEFAVCDPRPERLPFERPFDLVTAFSVFTHLSEPAHAACLGAIHAAMAPGGIFVTTIRSPGYLTDHPLGEVLRTMVDADPVEALTEPRYLFSPHLSDPTNPQYHGGPMDYGETVISLPYVRERWADRFELLDVSLTAEDIHQVALTLRRRD